MIIKRKQAVLLLLIAILGLAVYLNVRYHNNADDVLTANAQQTNKVLGEAKLVSGETQTASDTSTQASSQGGDYFTQARFNRQSSRDEAVDLLTSISQSQSANSETKQKASADLIQITKDIQQEGNIENLIKAKGFSDCVVHISDGSVNVVVKSDGLIPSQATQIKDIVVSNTGTSADKIKIIEVK